MLRKRTWSSSGAAFPREVVLATKRQYLVLVRAAMKEDEKIGRFPKLEEAKDSNADDLMEQFIKAKGYGTTILDAHEKFLYTSDHENANEIALKLQSKLDVKYKIQAKPEPKKRAYTTAFGPNPMMASLTSTLISRIY
ncbi:hypothetical protein Cantr_03547 [Candida viswanathii]|uniref:Uncharacterized protein n=1 Tax=Candida viswanathii TaxID=5486 RepID=A0A367YKY0_9ASCO|nr:hypothetical protein Cantr_03547 [Candida viswanathii]